MFAHEFFRNAVLAGTFVALACGVVGYFVVLRAQVFAGDALSHVAFTGALAAAAAGLDTRIGLFGRRSPSRSCSALSAGAQGPTMSRSGSSSPGSSAWASSSSRFQPGAAAANGCSAPVPCLARSSGSAQATPASPRWSALASSRRAGDRPAAAVRQLRPGSRGRAWGSRRTLGLGFLRSWARPRQRRRRQSARCCCSACSPRQPAPRNGSRPTPTSVSRYPPCWA